MDEQDTDKLRDEIVRRMIATPPKPKPTPKRESNPPMGKKRDEGC